MPDASSTAVTIYHNPNCGSSKNALAALSSKCVDLEVVEYLKNPRTGRRWSGSWPSWRIRSAIWSARTRCSPSWIWTHTSTRAEPVIELLLDHKALMQRPIIVTGDRAIIGRPTSRVKELLAD